MSKNRDLRDHLRWIERLKSQSEIPPREANVSNEMSIPAEVDRPDGHTYVMHVVAAVCLIVVGAVMVYTNIRAHHGVSYSGISQLIGGTCFAILAVRETRRFLSIRAGNRRRVH